MKQMKKFVKGREPKKFTINFVFAKNLITKSFASPSEIFGVYESSIIAYKYITNNQLEEAFKS